MTKPKYNTREEWLTAALWKFVDAHFIAQGYDVPPNIRVACSLPSKLALPGKKQRIGECWSSSASTDEHFEIMISPFLDDGSRVLDILIHEVVHATVGSKVGHRKPFSQCAKKVGLVKPWTATHATDDLKVELAGWLKELGPYPHARLSFSPKDKEQKQSTRMLLMECSACGCKVRTTRKWIDEYGPVWLCPCGKGQLATEELNEVSRRT